MPKRIIPNIDSRRKPHSLEHKEKIRQGIFIAMEKKKEQCGSLKICTKCNQEKLLECFHRRKNGRKEICITCRKLEYQLNKEKFKVNAKKLYHFNRQSRLDGKKQYYKNNKETVIKKIINYQKDRMKNDIQFKLSKHLRSRLGCALKNNFKFGSAVRDLGCSISELKQHLESLFQPDMTWENYGKFGWHIDHIKPLSKFDLTDRQQLLEAVHYTNLQPLWWEENISKGSKEII